MSDSRDRIKPRRSLVDLVRASIHILCHDGFKIFVIKLLGETIYRRADLITLPLANLPKSWPVPSGIRIAQLSEDDLVPYCRLRPGLSRAENRTRLAEGQRCYVAWHQQEIIAAAWVNLHRGWLEYLQCSLPLARRSAYYYNVYVRPAYRGRRLAGALASRSAHDLVDEGFDHLYAELVPENQAACRAKARAGWQRVSRIASIRLGVWKWYLIREEQGWTRWRPHAL